MKAKQAIGVAFPMKTTRALLFATATVALAAPASAHHSRTMFDTNITKVLRGSIVEFDFVNPHAFIILNVENEDGTSTTWDLEGTNAMGLIRDGWRPTSLRAGDVIQVEIHPLRSGAPGGEWRAGDVRLFDEGSEAGIPPLERDGDA